MALFTEDQSKRRDVIPIRNALGDRVRRFIHERVPACHDLVVEYEQGTVVLQGRVPSAHDHRMCLECSQHVAGVIHIVDKLHVVSE